MTPGTGKRERAPVWYDGTVPPAAAPFRQTVMIQPESTSPTGSASPGSVAPAGAGSGRPGGAEGAGPPIPYMQRTRAYYLALGYDNPYRWAHFRGVPFTPLGRPLRESTVALVTTAAPYRPELGDQGPGAAYNGAAKYFDVYSASADPDAGPDVRISHVSYDRTHTTAKDPRTWFPLARLHDEAAAAGQAGLAGRLGRIGRVAPRFHGLPTNRSQRTTLDQDCPALLRRVHEDEADAAILVAN